MKCYTQNNINIYGYFKIYYYYKPDDARIT